MSASYPGAIKTFTTKNTGDTIQASHVGDLQDEVTAIETALLGNSTLGTVSAGASTLASLSVTGGSTLTGTVQFEGAVIWGPEPGAGTFVLSSGNTDNLAVSSAVSLIRVTPNSSGSTLTGLAFAGGAANRQMLLLSNVATTALVLAHGTGSASTGQFLCPNNAAITIRGNGSVWLYYDANSPIWRVVGI